MLPAHTSSHMLSAAHSFIRILTFLESAELFSCFRQMAFKTYAFVDLNKMKLLWFYYI